MLAGKEASAGSKHDEGKIKGAKEGLMTSGESSKASGTT